MAKRATAASISIFDAATTVDQPATTSRGKAKKPVLVLPQMDDHAQFNAVISAVEALQADRRGEMDPLMIEYFAKVGTKAGRKPTNPDGAGPESIGSGSLQARKRTSRSPLSPEEIELLEGHNLPMEKQVLTAETFVIEPGTPDEDTFLLKLPKSMMTKVGEALAALAIDPKSVVRQPETSAMIVSDDTIEAVYGLELEAAKEVLPVVTSLSVGSKVREGFTMEECLKTVAHALSVNPGIVTEALTEPSKLNAKTKQKMERRPRTAKVAA